VPAPAASRRNKLLSALIAQRAASEATKVRTQGTTAVATVVITHQIANAQTSDQAVAEMLAEQSIDQAADSLLNLLGFTTNPQSLDAMLADVQTETELEFQRLVASLVQDAGRAAESVAVAVRENVGWVRNLTLPSCSRCAVLAGRLYRWSDGFLRHPNCDCTHTAVREGDRDLVEDPADLARRGLVTGLSKLDRQALDDGADFGQVVNVKLTRGDLFEAGHALTRGGRLTPAGIYRLARGDRIRALELLAANGYIR
jgi:hypothetical protein